MKKFSFRHRNEKTKKKKKKDEEVFVAENHLGIWLFVLKTLHCLYRNENQLIPVRFHIFIVSISERAGGGRANKIPVWPSNVHFYASDSNWKTFTMQLLVHEIPCGILIAIDELAREMRKEERERA